MKAFFTSYEITKNMSRSFSEVAFGKPWLRALREFIKEDSVCFPQFLLIILKRVFPEYTEDQLVNVRNALSLLSISEALAYFQERKDFVSWDILTEFARWKHDVLPHLIKRSQLYWDILKSPKKGKKMIYPPFIHGFINLASMSAKDLALELLKLPFNDQSRNLFFMLVFKFFYDHRIDMSPSDPYDFEFDKRRKDENYSLYKKVTAKMFGFIREVEDSGFKVVSRFKKSETIYDRRNFFFFFLSKSGIKYNKNILFLTIVKHYLFFYFVKDLDSATPLRIETNLR